MEQGSFRKCSSGWVGHVAETSVIEEAQRTCYVGVVCSLDRSIGIAARFMPKHTTRDDNLRTDVVRCHSMRSAVALSGANQPAYGRHRSFVYMY